MSGAMRCPILTTSLLFLALMAVASSWRSYDQTCTCLPTHWEGKMASKRRTLDLTTGEWLVSENVWTVHYEYRRHRLAAMLNKRSDTKIIADSSKGVTYMLTELGCHAIRSGVKVERTCKPEYAEAVNYLNLADGRAAVRWQTTGPINTTTRTTVVLDDCLPVSQDVYSAHKGFVMIVASEFSDVRRGIEDPHVFDVPQNCKMLEVADLSLYKRFYHDASFPHVHY